MEEITPGNGYHHDMTGAVFRGRLVFGDTDALPCVTILEEPLPAETASEGATGDGGVTFYSLMVQGFVKDDKTNPTDPAQWLLADVKKRLADLRREGRDDRGVFLLGPKAPMVESLSMGAGVVRPPDETSVRAYFWLTVTLKLIEDHEYPFV